MLSNNRVDKISARFKNIPCISYFTKRTPMRFPCFNSYLCNKLGKVIFFLTRCGIFNRDEVEIKNASSKEKTLFLRIAHMIFSTGVWKIHKIWIFLIYY
jgi:hypothetical protein